MKDTSSSFCERGFVLNAASEYRRVDGRKPNDFRKVYVYFGLEWGLCHISLGETRVVSQVSCEVQQPKTTRPNEGLLFINVEFSSMASQNIEPGKTSDINNNLNRLLEKIIKDSKAVDLESLCLVVEEKVWALRVDLIILNHDGNLELAASMAALAALSHFRRPDVTTTGQEIIIHDVSERDPIPLTLHHHPVCISYALLNNCCNILADPILMEEKASDGSLVFGMNAFGQICGLHFSGSSLVEPSLIMKYGNNAAVKAKEIVDTIKEALKYNLEVRETRTAFCSGLVNYIPWDKIKSSSDGRLRIQLERYNSAKPEKENISAEKSTYIPPDILDLGENCAEMIPPQDVSSYELDTDDEESEVVQDKMKKRLKRKRYVYAPSLSNSTEFISKGIEQVESESSEDEKKMNTSDSEGTESKCGDEINVVEPPLKKIEQIELSGDSEDEVFVLDAEDLNKAERVPEKDENVKNSSTTFPKRSESSETQRKKKRRKN